MVFTLVVCSLMYATIASSSSVSQQTTDVSSSRYQTTYTLTFFENDFSFDTLRGYTIVQLNDGGYTSEAGKPMVPMKTVRIALPTGMKATGVKILTLETQSIDGSYTLYPAQVSQPIGDYYRENHFVQPDAQTYRSIQFYPSTSVEFTGQRDWAGQSIADVTVYPLRYIPLQKKLILITSITFTIEGIGGYVCGDYLPKTISDNARSLIETMVQTMVMNPQDVTLQSTPNPQPAGVDPGDYDYVIITQDSWVDAFQPLKDWKTKKGVPANIVTTTWIYNSGGYSGTNIEKIRAFVQDVYSNWGTIYVLLGGDIDVIPCHYKTFPSVDSDPVANDVFYADFDNDWVCEVNIGRASVTGPGDGAGQIGNFIYKVLTYETDPPLTNYAKNIAFFGFNLDSGTPAEQCKINIDTTYIPGNWTMTTVYDSQTGNHLSNVIAAMNAGQNLLNHADHSGSDYMGTGYVNHDWGLENSNMDGLFNGDKQGILYSMGCDPAAYDQSNCIAEHFVRNNNGGGVAFIGNSRYGWYYGGSFDTLSMGYDAEFFESIFQDNLYNLGAAFSDHKNDGYQNDDYYKYCYTELTLLGDPELPIWKENPIALSATYPEQIPVGTSTFTVTVTSGSSPVNGACVCLWKGTDVYLIGSTNGAGEVTFSPSPTSEGFLSVTVTKQNHLPFEGSIVVGEGENYPPLTPATPKGPTTGGTNIEYTFETNTTDPDNDPVWYQWKFGSDTTSWIGPYSSGAQAEAQHLWTAPGTYEVMVKAKDQNNFESDWSSSLFITITEEKPVLSIGTINGGLFGVSANIHNSGPVTATNVQWNIHIDGDLILAGGFLSGTIPSLSSSGTAFVKDIPVLGFGQAAITVTVSAEGIPEVTKTVDGLILFIYIIV
jgi:hypothetical protein